MDKQIENEMEAGCIGLGVSESSLVGSPKNVEYSILIGVYTVGEPMLFCEHAF